MVAISHLVSYKTLLQDAAATFLQNANKFYLFFTAQFDSFITKCDSFEKMD